MQRPKIFFDDDGSTPLFLICGVRRWKEEPTRTVVIPFNVPANDRFYKFFNETSPFEQKSPGEVKSSLKETNVPSNGPTLNNDPTEEVFEVESDDDEEYVEMVANTELLNQTGKSSAFEDVEVNQKGVDPPDGSVLNSDGKSDETSGSAITSRDMGLVVMLVILSGIGIQGCRRRLTHQHIRYDPVRSTNGDT